jgi:Recombination endonuclease VII
MTAPKQKRAKQLGITDSEYARLLDWQGGGCAICGGTSKRKRKDGAPYKLHADHNHRTGRVRGLLCFRCNRALPTYTGSEWLRRACEYVARDEQAGIEDQWAALR